MPPALCFDVLDLQTSQLRHPAACKPSPEACCEGQAARGAVGHGTAGRGGFWTWCWWYRAGGWSTLESPWLLGRSFSCSLQPAKHQRAPLGALPTQSALGQGAYGETEAQNTPVTKALKKREANPKYPAAAHWNRTRRPQELLADGPTGQGAAFPLPAALQLAPVDEQNRSMLGTKAHQPSPGRA